VIVDRKSREMMANSGDMATWVFYSGTYLACVSCVGTSRSYTAIAECVRRLYGGHSTEEGWCVYCVRTLIAEIGCRDCMEYDRLTDAD
jgi:hypothetical protein